MKAIHELGHGYVAKAYGAEVREMGIMFLVFFPIPYVDASAATAFKSKYRRAAVSAAGILVEVFIAALAMYVWTVLEPGLARAFAFNTMLIAGFSTIIANGNPLLRFDGYFIMADLIEIPNLGPRSNRYLGYLMDRYIYRGERVQPYVASRGEKLIFLFYAPAAFVYRMFIMATIALFVAGKFFFIGVLLAIWAATTSIGMPIYKGLKHVFTDPKLRRTRRRAIALTLSPVVALVIAMLMVPAPLSTQSEGVVWLPEAAHVRARTDGFAEQLLLQAGTEVRPGDALMSMHLPALKARINSLTWKVRELELKLAKHLINEPVEQAMARLELREARAELRREELRQQRLVARSESHGTFQPSRTASDLTGRFYHKGQLVGYVVPPAATTARVVVPQDDIDLVRDHLRSVEIKLVDRLNRTYSSQILREVPAAKYQLPNRAIGQFGGGAIAVDPRDPEGTKTLNRVFQFDLALPKELADISYNTRVLVRFEHDWEPLGRQLYRRARQLLLSQFDA